MAALSGRCVVRLPRTGSRGAPSGLTPAPHPGVAALWLGHGNPAATCERHPSPRTTSLARAVTGWAVDT